MIDKAYCFDCDTVVTYTVKEEIIRDFIRGHHIEFIGKNPYCNICNEVVDIYTIVEENELILKETYREKAKLITIEEIQTILKKYNIGARVLSKSLKWDTMTLPKYIKGELPSMEHSEILKSALF